MWRVRKVGPPYLKMPGLRGAVLYRETDVLAYIAERAVLTAHPAIVHGRLRHKAKS